MRFRCDWNEKKKKKTKQPKHKSTNSASMRINLLVTCCDLNCIIPHYRKFGTESKERILVAYQERAVQLPSGNYVLNAIEVHVQTPTLSGEFRQAAGGSSIILIRDGRLLVCWLVVAQMNRGQYT